MGTWSTSIQGNDAFADVYSDFFYRYNRGENPDNISKDLIKTNLEILEIKEERNNFWFAIGLAQWETKSLSADVLKKIEDIISSGEDLSIWQELGARHSDLKKREIVLKGFLEKIKSERPKAKARKKSKTKIPIFETGDCLVFKMDNGNYGGAVVLASDNNPLTGYNLVATIRINQAPSPH